MPELESPWLRQAAAIPMRDGLVCLVSSRSRKRWVVPKGIIDPGQTAAEAALVETWEEAGLTGRLSGDPVGTFFYRKWEKTCHVTVFHMEVNDEAEDWPERRSRERVWLDPAAAAAKVNDEGLRELLLAVAPRSLYTVAS